MNWPTYELQYKSSTRATHVSLKGATNLCQNGDAQRNTHLIIIAKVSWYLVTAVSLDTNSLKVLRKLVLNLYGMTAAEEDWLCNLLYTINSDLCKITICKIASNTFVSTVTLQKGKRNMLAVLTNDDELAEIKIYLILCILWHPHSIGSGRISMIINFNFNDDYPVTV